MTTIPAIYVATDGTQFDDEDECLDYEYKTALDAATFVMLDVLFKRTEFPESCEYLETHSLDELKLFNKLSDERGCIPVSSEYYDAAAKGTVHFYWDEVRNDYGCFEDDIEKSLNIINKFKERA